MLCPVRVSVQGNLRAANARVCFIERLSKPKNDLHDAVRQLMTVPMANGRL